MLRLASRTFTAPTVEDDGTRSPCPMCSGASRELVMAVDFGRIWQTLESVYRVRFPREIVERHSPHPKARLWQCATCGLQYFSPAVAGDSDFWGALMRTNESFYHGQKPEFQVVLDLIHPGMRVLDVGCGLGTFVKAAAQLGAVSIGLEQNETAAADAQAGGIDVRTQTVEHFALGQTNNFDIVTIFQVIEHVQPILPFVTAAYECVKPGGLLFISVPYRGRLRPAGFEVLDHPPHHVSRWDATPIYWLTSRLGATVNLEFDQLSERDALAFRVGRIFPAEGGLRLRARNALVKLTWLTVFSHFSSPIRSSLRKRGWLDGYGHTLIAKIQKPQAG